ncbi:MAG: hypothetical protein HQM10_08220 [Candidatus Riflebacteria bacterium]|nr:hypothetical protein [Candidatus Riflebacteria bacterium]
MVSMKKGISLLETIVVAAILVVLAYQVFFYLRSSSVQGEKQDKAAKGWHTYCRFVEALRMDLAKATKIQVIDEKTLELEIAQMTPDLIKTFTKITWRQDNKTKIVRNGDPGNFMSFDFSESLLKNESIFCKFSR